MGTFYINLSYEQKMVVTHMFAVEADNLDEAMAQVKQSVDNNKSNLMNLNNHDDNVYDVAYDTIKGCKEQNICLYDTDSSTTVEL